MTVREVIVALLGIDPETELCISDTDGAQESIKRIEITWSHGVAYADAILDRATIAKEPL